MGRPPAGLKGEKISEAYQTVTFRVPQELRAGMKFAAGVLNRPLWRLLIDAYQAYVGDGEPLSAKKLEELRFKRKMKAKYPEEDD